MAVENRHGGAGVDEGIGLAGMAPNWNQLQPSHLEWIVRKADHVRQKRKIMLVNCKKLSTEVAYRALLRRLRRTAWRSQDA